MMCACDDNPAQCSTTLVRTARKAHRCYECSATIAPGERYRFTSGIWDGEPASFRWCADCASIAALCREVSRAEHAVYCARVNAGRGPAWDSPDWFCFCYGELREAAAEFIREPWAPLVTVSATVVMGATP